MNVNQVSRALLKVLGPVVLIGTTKVELADGTIKSLSEIDYADALADIVAADAELGLRVERDRRLADSDVLVFADRWASMTDEQRAELTDYRQQLRDLPAVTENPASPEWPTPPEV